MLFWFCLYNGYSGQQYFDDWYYLGYNSFLTALPVMAKCAFDQDFENVRNAVDGVLPSEENYTALTKTLDDFVLTLNRQSPSIFMSNLKFSQPRMDADEEYAILPFSMTLSTTRANLERFLQYTENSGSLDDASRLLDVRSITINFPGETGLGQEQELLTVSLSLNAYFQTQQTEEQ